MNFPKPTVSLWQHIKLAQGYSGVYMHTEGTFTIHEIIQAFYFEFTIYIILLLRCPIVALLLSDQMS